MLLRILTWIYDFIYYHSNERCINAGSRADGNLGDGSVYNRHLKGFPLVYIVLDDYLWQHKYIYLWKSSLDFTNAGQIELVVWLGPWWIMWLKDNHFLSPNEKFRRWCRLMWMCIRVPAYGWYRIRRLAEKGMKS